MMRDWEVLQEGKRRGEVVVVMMGVNCELFTSVEGKMKRAVKALS